MSDEDTLVNALVDHHRDDEAYDFVNRVEILPESHYNHYGNRGAVDLAVYIWTNSVSGRPAELILYEVKGDAAVQHSTGANEIIRQFNRMREYYLRDEDNAPAAQIQFELAFVPTSLTVDHVVENYNMYQTAVNQKIRPVSGDVDFKTQITFRSPDDITACVLPMEDHDSGDTLNDWYQITSEWNLNSRTAKIVMQHLGNCL